MVDEEESVIAQRVNYHQYFQPNQRRRQGCSVDGENVHIYGGEKYPHQKRMQC